MGIKTYKYNFRIVKKRKNFLSDLGVDASGLTAADLGASVGGFTDCLLQHGARRVYALDTAYGILDWRLRQDDRVVVMERTNAMHASLPERVDLVTVDVGWTRMGKILPAAYRMVKDGSQILALLKPQYEADPDELE